MTTDDPGSSNGAGNAADDSLLVVPVMREQLHVGKRTVDSGRGVRIHKTVTEEPTMINEALLRDAVNVRRVSIDRIVLPSDAPVTRQEGDTLIVPVLEEILVVEKRIRIKEEIHITRTATSHAHTDTVMLKSEHVAVERFDDNGPDLATQPNTGSTPRR